MTCKKCVSVFDSEMCFVLECTCVLFIKRHVAFATEILIYLYFGKIRFFADEKPICPNENRFRRIV